MQRARVQRGVQRCEQFVEARPLSQGRPRLRDLRRRQVGQQHAGFLEQLADRGDEQAGRFVRRELGFAEPRVQVRRRAIEPLNLWADIRDALRQGAVFAGEFFGPHDEWFGRPRMNFHDRAGVEGMLTGLDVLQLAEEDRRGMSFEGPKHWHVFHVVARA